MNSLATCISESLIDLADDPETDPNWQSVFELEDEGVERPLLKLIILKNFLTLQGMQTHPNSSTPAGSKNLNCKC